MTNHPNRNWRRRWPDEAAAFVRSWREEHGHTQAALADLLGTGKRAVEYWESGERVPPPYLRYALERLASVSGANN